MLSVTQVRTIQWSRDASELDDARVLDIATAMFNSPIFWIDLEDGQMRSERIVHDGRSYLVIYFCLTVDDDIVLEIMQVQ